MFQIFDNRGFQVTFENGFTVSVMFGSMNFCSNKGKQYVAKDRQCQDAEIAVFNGETDIMIDSVWGNTDRKSPEYLAELMPIVATFAPSITVDDARDAIRQILCK